MIYIEHFLAAWFERRREQSGDAGVNANGDITSMYPNSEAIILMIVSLLEFRGGLKAL